MTSWRVGCFVAFGALCTAAGACGLGADMVCAGVGIDGIVVDVRDPAGNSALPGATVIAIDGGFADTVGPVVPSYNGSLSGPTGPTASLAENRGGDYVVVAYKPSWSAATRQVHVPGGRCGYVETQTIQLTIALTPGAPAVRSVAVAPRFVRFGFCGSGAQAAAYVEGDPGIPSGVTWQSENTAVVAVSQSGLVSVRSHGTTRVRVRAVADTNVVGYMTAQVDPSC